MSKIFGIGFHKTGTTTLDSALQILGFNAAPVRTDLVESLSNGDFEPTLEVARKYDVFQDNPWPIIYKKMHGEFPEAKFILTVRDDQKWLKSVNNSFGGKSTKMREWIYGEGNGDPQKTPDVYLERYVRHNQEVRNYFAGSEGVFLELNWEKSSNWEELCAFLNLPVPEIDFPHSNKGEYGKKKKFRWFRR